MADFDHNPRGGLTTNRESLHASAEYKRQVAALEQMRESEMDERMTLEQVRIVLAGHVADDDRMTMATQRLLLQAIDAHLTQSAQAVDVAAIREVITELTKPDVLHGPFEKRTADKLTRAIGNAQAEGCTSTDAGVLRKANHALAGEIDVLREALQFYADRNHFMVGDDDAWDTVSGEPQNYWCDEAGTATVEDGSIARQALTTPPTKATPNAHE